MAALYEGYTLCGRVSGQSLSDSGIQGIEVERDNDHVIVTDSSRSVTLYMVSDQKPLSTWTVKQGQTFTCPAVYNSQTKEYVAVSDSKVIRIWKEEDMLLDKVFKSTVSSDIWRVHMLLYTFNTFYREPIVDVCFFSDFLCIWNTNFQTLQAGKEMAGQIYGQLWRYSNKLFIPHGKMLSVIPYECPKSCLSSALGKLRQAKTEGITFISPLHSNESILTNVKVCVNFLVQTAPLEEVQKEVEELLSHADSQDLQFSVGHLASALVSRSLANPSFYTSDILVQLVRTQFLCHSVCPDLLLLALERKDYFLCQLCLQFFPDIPEAMTCACLKAFISMPDADAEKVTLEPDSISFMEALIAREHGEASVQNGFSSSDDKDCSDALEGDGKARISAASEGICPVELHKAALLNEVLQTAYSDTFLLPHLKDLSSRQIILFLQYLHYLYLRYCQDASLSKPDVRSPSLTQIMDWICLLLDAHFTVLVMTPEARGLLMSLHIFVKSQVKLVSELGKIEASFQELDKMKVKRDVAQYSIEIIELL
uniref:Nucleolar protein 11 n=1 Tax=Takifugu rubripes TaxID=31033 RepID=A0A674NID3_TAKRU